MARNNYSYEKRRRELDKKKKKAAKRAKKLGLQHGDGDDHNASSSPVAEPETSTTPDENTTSE